MTFKSQPSEHLRKTLGKLRRRDYVLFIAVKKKMRQIASLNSAGIDHFKNLRGRMSHLKRVQIGCFILTFQVKGDIIIFEDFDHHDRAYR